MGIYCVSSVQRVRCAPDHVIRENKCVLVCSLEHGSIERSNIGVALSVEEDQLKCKKFLVFVIPAVWCDTEPMESVRTRHCLSC